jgi:protein TonB
MTAAAGSTPIDDDGRAGWRGVLVWAGAFLVVLGTQGAGAYWLLNRPPEDFALEGNAPEAIMLELAPLPAPPETAPAELPPQEPDLAPTPEPVEEAVEPPPPEPEPIIEEPPPEPAIEPPPPEPEPEPLPEPEPEPLPEPEPEPEPLPEPEPVVEEIIPESVEVPEPAVVAPLPVQQSARLLERRQRPRTTTPRPPAQPAPARTAAPAASAAPKAAPAASAQPAARPSAPSVSPARWQSQLVSYLNQRKRYPRAAQNRREEGLVQLEFSIDPRGNVLSARIARSSGYPDLDEAVMSMIQRASPVPAPPAELAQSRLTLTVPIQFEL